ncbi:MAG: beta/gamma crystallin family protein [Hyphomonadaceae bacterium]|nr:beta/gamma crystallin family protein [Hyphomonadaceae bacterium]
MDLKWLSRLAATATAALVFTAPALADGEDASRRQAAAAQITVGNLLGGSPTITFHNGQRNADRDRDRDHHDRDWDRDDDHHDWRDRDRDHNDRDRNRNHDWRDRDHRDNDWRSGNRYGNRGAIILYADPGYRGRNYALNGAQRSIRHTGLNDEVSSIRVRNGTWLVCTDPDYRGNCAVIRSDQAGFPRHGLNDRISSLRPISDQEARRYGNNGRGWGNNRDWGNRDWGNAGYGGAGIVVFVDPNGRGRSMTVNSSLRELRARGFNDNISSIRVNSGRWEICSDPDYRGRCRIIDRSIGSTRDIGLNDNISSIRRVDGRGDRGWSW